jgi:hypothetical protein
MATCEKCPDQTGCQEGDCCCECHEPPKSPHLTKKLITCLGLLFVALRLFHVIGWSWWWVLSPFLFGIGTSLILGIVVGIGEVRAKKG